MTFSLCRNRIGIYHGHNQGWALMITLAYFMAIVMFILSACGIIHHIRDSLLYRQKSNKFSSVLVRTGFPKGFPFGSIGEERYGVMREENTLFSYVFLFKYLLESKHIYYRCPHFFFDGCIFSLCIA